MEERFKFKQLLKIADGDQAREVLEKQISEVEKKLAESVCTEYFNQVKEQFSMLTNSNDSFCSIGLWKIKKKVFPKHSKPLPVAKVDSGGRVVTTPEELKKLYLNTYVQRLRHRPIRPELKYLESLKTELFYKRLELVKYKTIEHWTLEDLRVVLKSLKNKSRDPRDLINELFKPENIGSDMECSLLLMLVKKTFTFPEIMHFANIMSIYKGRGKMNSLENDRGIFIINIFRSILLKLIYKEEYETIDSNMSDSNIGARKRKNIRNHIFILNGIIN